MFRSGSVSCMVESRGVLVTLIFVLNERPMLEQLVMQHTPPVGGGCVNSGGF